MPAHLRSAATAALACIASALLVTTPGRAAEAPTRDAATQPAATSTKAQTDAQACAAVLQNVTHPAFAECLTTAYRSALR